MIYIYNLNTKAQIHTVTDVQEFIKWLNIPNKKKLSLTKQVNNALLGYKGYGFYNEYFISNKPILEFWTVNKQITHFNKYISKNYENIISKITSMTYKTLGDFNEDTFIKAIEYLISKLNDSSLKGVNSIDDVLSFKYRMIRMDEFRLNSKTLKSVVDYEYDFNNIDSIDDSESELHHQECEQFKFDSIIRTIKESLLELKLSDEDVTFRLELFNIILRDTNLIANLLTTGKSAIIKVEDLNLSNDLINYIESQRLKIVKNFKTPATSNVIKGIISQMITILTSENVKTSLRLQFKEYLKYLNK